LPFLVIEDADKTLARLQADGIETVAGNAAKGEVFASANAAGAKRLILAIPNAFEAGQIILRARAANPAISIIARAHFDAEVEHLTGLGADTVIMGEREIARGIVQQVLEGDVEPPLAGDEPATPDGTKPTEPPAAA
jgi:CPA2 family monovalent cation:H+ antiporter-2